MARKLRDGWRERSLDGNLAKKTKRLEELERATIDKTKRFEELERATMLHPAKPPIFLEECPRCGDLKLDPNSQDYICDDCRYGEDNYGLE